MPQVPVLSRNQVGTAPDRPNYERPLDVSQGGREVALTLTAVNRATDLVEDRTAQDDALRVQAALTEEFSKFSAKERAEAQGRNADGHVDRVNAWWDKAKEQYGEAVSPRAQRLVGQQLQRARSTSVADAAVFQEHQLNISHMEALGLAQKALIGRAIGNAQDAATVAGPGGAAQAARIGLAEIRTNAANVAKAQGKPPEWVEAQVLAASTDVHAGVIQSIAINDPTAASNYYKAHRDQIDPRLWDNLDKQLTAASAANDATNAAETVWAQMGPKTYNDPVAVDKMEAKIREDFKTDATRRKLALAELRERTATHNRAQIEFTAANKNGALEVYQKTRSLASVEKSPEYSRLTSGEQLQVTSYITNLQASQLAKQEAALNRDTAAIRRQEAADMRNYAPAYLELSNPALLAGMSRTQVSSMVTTLGPRYTEQLLRTYDSIAKSEDKFVAAKLAHETQDAILRDMGINPGAPRKSPQAALAGEARSRMNLALDAAQQNAKTKLTQEEMASIMREEAARTVTVPNKWWEFGNEEVPVMTLSSEQLARVELPTGKDLEKLMRAMNNLYAQTGDPAYAKGDDNLRRLYLRLDPKEGGLGSRTSKFIPGKKEKPESDW